MPGELDGRAIDTITEVGATAWREAIEHGFFTILDLAMGGNYPDGEGNPMFARSCTGRAAQWWSVYRDHTPRT